MLGEIQPWSLFSAAYSEYTANAGTVHWVMCGMYVLCIMHICVQLKMDKNYYSSCFLEMRWKKVEVVVNVLYLNVTTFTVEFVGK